MANVQTEVFDPFKASVNAQLPYKAVQLTGITSPWLHTFINNAPPFTGAFFLDTSTDPYTRYERKIAGGPGASNLEEDWILHGSINEGSLEVSKTILIGPDETEGSWLIMNDINDNFDDFNTDKAKLNDDKLNFFRYEEGQWKSKTQMGDSLHTDDYFLNTTGGAFHVMSDDGGEAIAVRRLNTGSDSVAFGNYQGPIGLITRTVDGLLHVTRSEDISYQNVNDSSHSIDEPNGWVYVPIPGFITPFDYGWDYKGFPYPVGIHDINVWCLTPDVPYRVTLYYQDTGQFLAETSPPFAFENQHDSVPRTVVGMNTLGFKDMVVVEANRPVIVTLEVSEPILLGGNFGSQDPNVKGIYYPYSRLNASFVQVNNIESNLSINPSSIGTELIKGQKAYLPDWGTILVLKDHTAILPADPFSGDWEPLGVHTRLIFTGTDEEKLSRMVTSSVNGIKYKPMWGDNGSGKGIVTVGETIVEQISRSAGDTEKLFADESRMHSLHLADTNLVLADKDGGMIVFNHDTDERGATENALCEDLGTNTLHDNRRFALADKDGSMLMFQSNQVKYVPLSERAPTIEWTIWQEVEESLASLNITIILPYEPTSVLLKLQESVYNLTSPVLTNLDRNTIQIDYTYEDLDWSEIPLGDLKASLQITQEGQESFSTHSKTFSPSGESQRRAQDSLLSRKYLVTETGESFFMTTDYYWENVPLETNIKAAIFKTDLDPFEVSIPPSQYGILLPSFEIIVQPVFLSSVNPVYKYGIADNLNFLLKKDGPYTGTYISLIATFDFPVVNRIVWDGFKYVNMSDQSKWQSGSDEWFNPNIHIPLPVTHRDH